MPFSDQHIELESFQIGSVYSRDDVARVGEVSPPRGSRDPNWGQGPVRFANAVLLFVTLDKSDRKDYQYEDRFEDGMFWWQSQNQQTQRSPTIRAILEEQRPCHLFARVTEKRKSRTCPFSYCGRLTEPIAEGQEPVTVLFENPDFRPDATGALREIYDWRPTKLPERTELRREQRIRTRTTRARGQGRVQDPRVREAVETHAMLAARRHYEALGCVVEDTHSTRSYDYVVTRGDDRRRVEVKGTQSDGNTVTLTGLEVEAVRAGPEPTDLFILFGIVVSETDGKPVASGGSMRLIETWLPNSKDLTPTEYRYAVPTEL